MRPSAAFCFALYFAAVGYGIRATGLDRRIYELAREARDEMIRRDYIVTEQMRQLDEFVKADAARVKAGFES